MSASYTTVSGYYPRVSHCSTSCLTPAKTYLNPTTIHVHNRFNLHLSVSDTSQQTTPEQAHTQLKFGSGALRFCSATLNICGLSPTSLQMRMMRRFERM